MKKLVCLTAAMLMLFLAACQNTESTPELSGKVAIFTEDTSIVVEDVTTHATNIEEVLVETCRKNKIPYTLTNNMFDNFGGIPSTQTDGWILYVNGEVAQAGAKFIPLEDNFLVEFKYVNYDEVFSLIQ